MRLWTSRCGRSLIDTLIQLLACSQAPRVNNKLEHPPKQKHFPVPEGMADAVVL